jgi:hypothetical protein
MKDQNFGVVFYGDAKPLQMDHLFMSIQTFNTKEFQTATSPDF